MRLLRSTAGLGVILALFALPVLVAEPASATTTLTVTTTADVVNGGDGVVSLREAITTANGSPIDSPILVVLATNAVYPLDRCAPTDDDNATGDLDVNNPGFSSNAITVVGNGSTVRQTCAGERIFDQRSNNILLRLEHLTLTGGSTADGAAIRSTGSLALANSLVTQNAVGLSDVQGGVIVTKATGSFEMTDSTVQKSTGTAIADAATGGSFTISGSHIIDNVGGYRAAGVYLTTRDATITRTELARNRIEGITELPEELPVGGLQGGRGMGGAITIAGGVFRVTGFDDSLHDNVARTNAAGIHGNATLADSSFVDNYSGFVGAILGQTVDLIRVTVLRNRGNTAGGVAARQLDLRQSSVEQNASIAVAESGSIDDGGIGGIAAIGFGGPSHVTIVDSSVVENRGSVGGLGSTTRTEVLRSTIAGNTGRLVGGVAMVGLPNAGSASLSVTESTVAHNFVLFLPPAGFAAGDLYLEANAQGPTTFARSVVGAAGDSPNAPGANCVANGHPLTSLGYNFEGDGSCGIGGATGDVVGTDPLLATLAANGSPAPVRRTMLPLPGSPLLDRIPLGTDGCPGVDQLGRPRPHGEGCDIGAVEAHLDDYQPVVPARLVDSRDAPAHPWASGETRTVDVAGHAGLPDKGMVAVVLNVTATDSSAPSHLTLWPSNTAPVTTSNLNLQPGRTVANLVIVPLGSNGAIDVRNNQGTTHVIIDVVGYHRGFSYHPVGPQRALDTRSDPLGPFGAGEARSLALTPASNVPASFVSAVLVNITATDASKVTHLTAWPHGRSLPETSNVNLVPGETTANLALLPLGPGHTIDLRNNDGSTNVIVDVVGYLTSAYQSIGPARIYDSRRANLGAPVPLVAGVTRTIPVTAPTGIAPGSASAVVVNVTATDSAQVSHLTVGADSSGLPPTSNLNLTPGHTTANLVVVPLGPLGAIDIRNNSGSTNVIVDIVGVYAGSS